MDVMHTIKKKTISTAKQFLFLKSCLDAEIQLEVR